MIEVTRKEPNSQKGSFQTTTWLFRYFGRGLAAGLGPVIWEATSDRAVFAIEAGLFIFQSVMGFLLTEEYMTKKWKSSKVIDTRKLGKDSNEQEGYLQLLYKTFSDSIFYKMVLFNILTGLLPSAGLSMFYFLSDELHYTPKTMALLDFVGQISQIVGVLCYKFGFKHFKIRRLYSTVIIFSTLISILPILITLPGKRCLVEDRGSFNNDTISSFNRTFTSEHCYLFREFGYPSLPFAFSDDVFGQILDELKNMPLLNLTGILCQQSVEGVAYSLSIGIQNWVVILQQPINSALTHAMNIDHNSFQNLPVLLVICSSLELLSICFVRFLPDESIVDISVKYDQKMQIETLQQMADEAEAFNTDLKKEDNRTYEELVII